MPTVFAWLQAGAAAALCRWFFLPAPDMSLDGDKRAACDRLLRAAVERGPGVIDYDLAYPRHEFLRYVVAHHEILLHGSNRADLDILQPRQQTDWNGRPITAVFASGDGIWPLFFATVDLAVYRGSLRNACFVVTPPRGRERRFYFFSINAEMAAQDLWTTGTVYILPRSSFSQTAHGVVRFDEWASVDPVRPLARLAISPSDFPFWGRVAHHREQESILVSWFCFKRRVRR